MNLNNKRNRSLRNWCLPDHQQKNAQNPCLSHLLLCCGWKLRGFFIQTNKPSNLDPNISPSFRNGLANGTCHLGQRGTVQWTSLPLHWNWPTSLKSGWCSGILGTNLNLSPRKKPPHCNMWKNKKKWPHSIWIFTPHKSHQPEIFVTNNPFGWQGAAAIMVMNMVYWMKAAPRPLAGFLSFENEMLQSWEAWIHEYPGYPGLEEMLAKLEKIVSCTLHVSKKWRAELDVSSEKKRILVGLKKRSTKNQGGRKENTNKTHPLFQLSS